MDAWLTCSVCGLFQAPRPTCTSCGRPLVGQTPPPSPPASGPPPTKVLTVLVPSWPEGRPPPPEDKPPTRLSWMAALSLVSVGAFWPAFLLLTDAQRCRRILPGEFAGHLYIAMLALLLLSVLLGGIAAIRVRRSGGRLKGLRLAQLGVTLGMISSLLSFMVLPNLMGMAEESKYRQGMGDAKTAVQQIILYAKTRGAYPTSLRVLRESGYPSLRSRDPWGNDWVLAPVLLEGGTPRETDDVHLYSRGPCGTGRYTPRAPNTGAFGSVGYSSLYGSFQGR